MSRVWNFSAGPAVLPESVLRHASEEMLDWQGTGLSVMEMSHRSKEYSAIFEKAHKNFCKLLNVPETHEVLFMQGGAVAMNAIVPMNLLKGFDQAAFINTGAWSRKTTGEFSKYGLSRVVLDNSSAIVGCAASCYVPDCTSLPDRLNGQQMAYLHYCDNETIGGVEFSGQIEALSSQFDCPVVADMSSNILSKTIDIAKYGVIYGGAQKNVGPAGLTIVIINKSLLNRHLPICPSAFTLSTVAENGSMFNTPPTYSIYIAGLVFEWLIDQGGVAWAQAQAQEKASLIYKAIDQSSLYRCPVRTQDRSRMNIPFTLLDDSLSAKFLRQASERGLVQLKGHKSVGGIRASVYNAMPIEGVKVLVEFMQEFEKAEA
jgi:phosphoserine aminotransferase